MLKSKEIADILGIKEVTVRKYASALEAAGYNIKRSESGQREYTELDATAFRELQALCKRSGMTVESSAFIVAKRHYEDYGNVAPAVVESQNHVVSRYEEQYTKMVEVMQSQNELIQSQADELKRLHSRMDDQNANITAILREVLETRRMVAASRAKKRWQFWKKDTVLPDLNDPEVVWKMKKE